MSETAPREGMTADEIDAAVSAVLAEASLAEKVAMMSGKGFFKAFVEDGHVWGARPYRAGSGCERLGVPPLYFTDGPRGVARGQSTCFPCTMARGASFDTTLELRIGEAMSIEIRAQDCTLSGAVCVNLLRHPAWGRAQETYGEDSHHLGEMGAALSTGLQTHNVIATVKHFALNSMENARFYVDVTIDERALHEVYLPHFKCIIDAGCTSVMSAYNKMNGEYCGQNGTLLTDILRGEWGFTGFVHSDWVMGVYQPYGATAGLDIENPEPRVFGKRLIEAVENGSIASAVIDTACRRILRTQYRFAAAQDPLPAYPLSLVASDRHRALALEAADKSAVLLSNDGILPIAHTGGVKIALLGRLAAVANTGDNGSSRVNPRHVVTALEGLTAVFGDESVATGNEDDLTAARAVAATADVAVIIVGYTAREEGEYIPGDLTLGQETTHADSESDTLLPRSSIGGDRTNLALPDDQIALINAAADTRTPIVVVIVAGSAVMVESWHTRANAILQTFYAGQEGGHALARFLTGAVNPSGRLPFTVARDAAHYPHFDRDAAAITYDYWHGYTKFERDGHQPRFGFGHGLSYTQFAYRGLKARISGDRIIVELTVHNTGERAGDEVVMLFVRFPSSGPERPARSLKAFTRASVAAGTHETVRLAIALDDLRYRDTQLRGWLMAPGDYTIEAMPVGAEACRTIIRL